MSKLTFLSSKKEAPPPLYKRHEKPTFKNTYEKEKYWDIEKQRWHRGYSGITGPHYFYLQEVFIKDIFGNIFRPHWRESDSLVFEAVEHAKKIFFDLFIVKRREFGLSSIFAGNFPLYTAITIPGSISLITSCDKPRMKALLNDKIIIAYDNLDNDIKPKRARMRQEGFLYLADEVKDEKSKTRFKGLRSTILGEETVDDPYKFKAHRAMYCFLDELFLHPKANTVRSSTSACLRKSTKKVGFMAMGGSTDQTSKIAGPEGVKIYTEAKNKEILTLFLAGWRGLEEYTRNGWDDEKAGTEWILRRREILNKAEDKTDYNLFVNEYPLTEAEALSMIADTTVLPREIVEASQRQSKIIIQDPPPIMNYDLFRKAEGKVEAKPNKNGKFVILELPQPDTEYGSGTDPIPFTSKDLGRGSDYTICIKKRSAGIYVAYYSDRSYYSDIVIDNAILLQDFYNGAKSMMEMEKGGVALQKYQDKGRTDLLSLRPSHLGIKYVIKKGRIYGFYANNISDTLNDLLIKYLAEHTKDIYFKRMLDEIRVYLDKNTDLLDAVRACELQEVNIIKKKEKEHPPPEWKEIPKISRDSEGKTYMEIVRVRTQ